MRARILLSVLLGIAAGPARADESAAIDRLLNFISNGCIGARVGGTATADFAKAQGAKPADPAVASALLGADMGTVYARDDPRYPLAIAARPGGPCTVHAKFPSGLEAMIAAVDDFLAGPGGGFYAARVFEEDAGTAGWTTHRVYLGQRRGRKFTLLFTTTPGAAGLEQVMVAAQETQP